MPKKPDDIDALRNLSERDLAIYNAESARYNPSVPGAYLLWFFFGALGLHKVYIGKQGEAGFIFLWSIGTVITSLAVHSVGFVMLMILGLIMLVDLLTLPNQIDEMAQKKRAAILKRLQSG